MKLQRFFISEKIEGDDVTVEDAALVHQLRNVFRKSEGDEVILLDNTGFEFVSTISEIDKKKVIFSVKVKKRLRNSKESKLTLFCSIIKKDNFELVVEKCTELGVDRIVPIVSQRSEKKAINRERLLKIIKEASEQSERGMLPILEETITLEDALKKYMQGESLPSYVLHTDPENTEKKSENEMEPTTLLSGAQSLVPFGLLIGPEGGWSENEILLFKNKSVKLFSLGPQILRAETAAIAATTLVCVSSSLSRLY